MDSLAVTLTQAEVDLITEGAIPTI
jgi:hypothetical protein